MLALDRKEREREMVSVMLAELHPRVLSEEEIGEGFTAIMLSCEVTSPFSSCRSPLVMKSLRSWGAHAP